LLPTRPEQFSAALNDSSRILIVEQSHSKQFYHYLCAYYRLPADTRVFAQAGPLPVRPWQIERLIHDWR
jgi:2-oxoglutarate ferredoxin oxidoreductase subunit alpha